MKLERKEITKFSNIREMLDQSVEQYGDQVAFRYKPNPKTVREATFREFYEATEALGAALTGRGWGGAHIACISENRYEWVVSYVTVLKSAGVWVPLDKELPAENLAGLLENSESRVLFVSRKFYSKLEPVMEKLGFIEKIVCFDEPESENVLSFAALLEERRELDKSAYDALKSDPEELKMLLYTSGTTGVAKGVMLTEHNIVSSVYYGLKCSQIYDHGLSILPWNHAYAGVCDLLVGIKYGTANAINDQLKAVVANLNLFKPEYIMVVPAVAELFYNSVRSKVKKEGKEKAFNALIKTSRALRKIGIDARRKLFSSVHKAFGGQLKRIVCGGAPIRPEIGKFFDDIGITLSAGYGITECSPLVCVNLEGATNFRSAGKKLDCLEWKIDQPNEEGIGEIVVKGDVVMKGYYKDPERTAQVLKDGWFFTGDYGYITPEDELVITGRKKNIIVLNNGKNIYPEEIEDTLMSIEAVTEVVVRGIKNEHGQEIALSAEIYMSEPIGEDQLRAQVDAQLAAFPNYKQIKDIIVRAEPFPKTSTNKILR